MRLWSLVRGSVLPAALLSMTTPVHAQVRASERGGVWQTVNGTTIRVDYGRPAARGRTLFGELVHWGEVWTPGANWATTLEVDRDVRINDVPVTAGEYSVWLVPREHGPWTLGLDARVRRFHTQRPDSGAFAVRIPVTPGAGPHVERLTFEFEDFARSGTTLRMHWGETVVPLEIRVRSTLARTRMTEQQLATYVGEYSMKIYGEGPEPQIFPLVLFAADGSLRGGDGNDAFVEFIPTDEPHVFLIGLLQDGELFDIEETKATFTIDSGRATGFVVPGTGIPIWMEGTRTG